MQTSRIQVFILFWVVVPVMASAQTSYFLTLETGWLAYQYNAVDTDIGPGWKGDYLNGQDGFAFDFVNGVIVRKKLFMGAGIGYLNFEGVHGYSVYGDIRHVLLTTRIAPLVGIKAGYSHIWNQYEGGTRTGLVELLGGVRFQMGNTREIYITSGICLVQQAFVIPLRVGLQLR